MTSEKHHLASLLVLVAVAVLVSSSPPNAAAAAVEYTVTNEAANTPGGARFDAAIGVEHSLQVLSASTQFIWATFQQTTAADVKPVAKVDLFIADYEKEYAGYAINDQIVVSARVLLASGGDDPRWWFDGLIYHEMAHLLQWTGNGLAPFYLTEGIADYVRLKAGYVPGDWVGPGGGDRWDQGYDVTARFLDYCEGLWVGFVAGMNTKMRYGYTDAFYQDLTGKTVDQLWTQYKAAYAAN